MVEQDKLGLYKRLKLEKVKKELEQIQSNGKESILLIAKRLIKELADQGYDITGIGEENSNGVYFSVFRYRDNEINLSGHKFEVRGK
ncbi:hypothetical protein KTC96_24980 (plasmid) [Clostridium estertheticum]|uniref:hypothetical protein n=1 Tax=Clostridium estertheticum TaxID=238834 RepID=UPI001C7DB897|nr:hypothetical protein [Clostridium estertheticum]MBX4259784.1 hypothetical protein [Clostridium estertheticum]WLC73276.1 hypothetical protein KTC96_24980 [Clostridium estertheticum]